MEFVVIDVCCDYGTSTKMNVHILSGWNPVFAFAKASIFMNCKIQTMCVKPNIRMSFTPPEVLDEDCLKILYYHHQNFTMCQRVLEIRMNERNKDSSKQLEQDFSKVLIQRYGSRLPTDYYVVY